MQHAVKRIIQGGDAVINYQVKGNFNKTNKWLDKLIDSKFLEELDKFGQKGVEALESATPKDTGVTASSWSYKINRTPYSASISWNNSNKTKTGIPIVILIQYGHATGTGGYVRGRDFINPAIRPVFDEIANSIVTKVAAL